jgi:SpoVK/Ycf46/Vps4 family AAA+-type ATPase
VFTHEHGYESYSSLYATQADGYFTATFNGRQNTFRASVNSLRKNVVDDTCRLFEMLIDRSAMSSAIHVLTTGDCGLTVSALGQNRIKFRPENYQAAVLKKLDYVVEEFKKRDPFGRLVLFHGPPGTGKSHLVRGLTQMLTNSLIIIVPPDMIQELGKPTFVKVLQSHKNERSLTLLFEDADEALVKRMSDNMSAISSLLNLTDGLLGDLLDLRIVATTNAIKLEMEPALMRRGRLLANIHVDRLNTEEAWAVLQSLCGGEDAMHAHLNQKYPDALSPFLADETYALGDVYSVYEGVAELPTKRDLRRVGFRAH